MTRHLPICSVAALAWSSILCAQVDVLTANYDNHRTNANLSEFVLNKSNVTPGRFGKLYVFLVDGEVYAQPLYVRGVNIGTNVVNLLYVATMNNTLYAFNADAPGTVALWSVHFGPPVNPHDFDFPPDTTKTPPTPGSPFTDILNGIGILGTPVIDRTTNTIYFVVYSFSLNGGSTKYSYFLHALDLARGTNKFGGKVEIQAAVDGSGWSGLETPVNGQVVFDPKQHLQRPGLLLVNGTVYVAFGSHGDGGPWHGWLMAYDAATLKQTAAFNTTAHNAGGGAIWQGGRGLAADGAGNIYLATGNGTWDGSKAWSESLLHLTNEGGLNVTDFFTPAEWGPLNDHDTDLGSSGPVLIPGTNLLYIIGKEGELFLMDKTNLGHVASSNGQIVQSFQAANPNLTLLQQENSFLIFNTAFWDNLSGPLLYLWPFGQSPVSYRMKNGLFETTPYSTNATAVNNRPMPGMTVSAYGSLSDTGILWATSSSGGVLPASATLHAFDALDLTKELWNSDMVSARDKLGNFTKFANPTVANGKVFQATASGEIVVYGLLPGQPGIASVVDAASYSTGGVAPGELVTVFGTDVGPTAPASGTFDPSGKLPVTLGGVQVTFNGKPAPLLYGSAGQINAVVPFEVASQAAVPVAVTQSNGRSFSIVVPVAAANPSIFSKNGSGTGPGAILNNADLTVNSAQNPAAFGSVIALFATGTGVTTPASVDGALTGANPPLVAQTVTATIGGQDAEVLYQGAAPGMVAGISQINVRIPTNISRGATVPVTISVGGVKSRNTVTVAIQ